MIAPTKHKWTFAPRFRRQAFGWRSHPAIERVNEAVAEIKAVAKRDPVLGAEGAVLLLEKLSPALEQVDSSSGAIGTAVNNAIAALAPIIAESPVSGQVRSKWLDRLWKAVEDDEMPYIESLLEFWGEFCHTPELASRWADDLVSPLKFSWAENRKGGFGFFKGTTGCLSALYAAERYSELLALLDLCPYKFWNYRQWGVKAMIATGRQAEALRYAEESRGLNEPAAAIAATCEQILLGSGLAEEAYQRYAIEANRKGTYLATFRAIAKKYPHKAAKEILADLVVSSPGNEGKWFAAAKAAGLYPEAIDLANRTPCDPKTLTRAARDLRCTEPLFAVEAGVAALRWLVERYGYEITGLDVREAFDFTMEAARNAGCQEETLLRIRKLVESENSSDRFVGRIIGRELGILEK